MRTPITNQNTTGLHQCYSVCSMWAPPELSDPTTQTKGKTWAEEMDLHDPLDDDKFNATNSAALKHLPS